MKTLKPKTIVILGCVLLLSAFNIGCNKKSATKESLQEEENFTQIGLVKFPNNSIKTVEEVESTLNSFYGIYNGSQKPIFAGIKKWIKTHIGTHLFENCTFDLYCGPCPGICFNLARYSSPTIDTLYSAADHANGIGKFCLTRTDSTHFVVEFVNNSEFVIDSIFYASSNIDLGDSLEALYETQKFIIKQGVYPLSYNQNANGKTIIDVIIK